MGTVTTIWLRIRGFLQDFCMSYNSWTFAGLDHQFSNSRTFLEFTKSWKPGEHRQSSNMQSLHLDNVQVWHASLQWRHNAVASQISSVSTICSTICSDADQRKHQSSASLAFVMGIHRWPVNSPHKGPVTRKMFSFDDVVMCSYSSLETTVNYDKSRTELCI